jgi:hypothetical protein
LISFYYSFAKPHQGYPVLNFLRSLFVVHEWNRPLDSNIRSCRVCGRREELDVDDGVNLAAWHPIWKGYPLAHFDKRIGKPEFQPPGVTRGDTGLIDGARKPAYFFARTRRAPR